jgi:DNA-binding transcriptional MocR family regulator
MVPDGSDENALVREAASRRVGVVGLAAHYGGGGGGPAAALAAGGASAPLARDEGAQGAPAPGLVLGFGNLPAPAIRRGVALLAEAARIAGA